MRHASSVMHMSWTKLHSKIVYSSIWSENPATCKVWITLLALADQHGTVSASRIGLARLTMLDIAEVNHALAVLEGPDENSSDGTTGERILRVDGGWVILNHAKYRDIQTPAQAAAARRAAAYRERKEASKAKHQERDASRESQASRPVTVTERDPSDLFCSVSDLSGSVEEREHEREETPKPSRTKSVPKPDKVDQQHWNDWLAARRAKRAGPVTETVLKMLIKEANLAGITLDKAVYYAAASNWITFKAAYMVGKQWDEVRKNDPDRWESSGEKYEDIDGDTPLF